MVVFSFSVNSAPPSSFGSAKRQMNKIFSDHRVTLYCACPFNQYKQVDLKSCGMEEAIQRKRAQRAEAEHMMPAENFGRQLPCWRERLCTKKNGKRYRGRRCCKKISSSFRRMEAELFNLWPAVGLINQARSNYRYSPLPWRHGYYGCDFKFDSKLRKAEPGNRAKGIVARANLFMAQKYAIKLSAAQRKLFKAWDKQFPPCAWEKTWAKRVAVIEGYPNSYIY